MEIIDTVTADAVEIGDIISLDGSEIEVLGLPDSPDTDLVLIRGHNLTTGDVETFEVYFLHNINILGA